MEDPWANAWGEPSKPAVHEPLPTLATTQILGTHSPEFDNDQEADLGMPSWSTGPAVIWDEPGTDTTLWSQPSPATDAWEPPPLSIGKVTTSEHSLSPNLRTLPDSPPVSVPQQVEPSPLPSPTIDATTRPRSPSPVYKSPHSSPPGSPDAFGTFESAATDHKWTSGTSTFPKAGSDGNEWGTAWGSSDTDRGQEHEKAPDEWLAAKLRKEKQDSQVPPELLSSILRQFEELSRGLWPEPDSSVEDRQVSIDRDWRANMHSGMEGVEDLTPAVNRLVPYDLTLPPSAQFMKTATSKNMVDALRLTRHVALTRSSPMAMYMASKGSTAWESSVKSRPEAVQDDLPVGWRLVDKGKEPSMPVSTDDRGRKTGGLLSFWGRKSSTVPVETKRERSSSPVPVPAALSVAIESARSSIESMKPHSTANITPKTTAPVVPSPAADVGVSRVATPQTVVSNTSATFSSQLDVLREPTPPPTLATRFLNRFSRAKSSSSPRNSIPLSSDDLEFLSDLVPNAGDDMDDQEDRNAQVKALSSMIQSPVPPIKFPPPPSKAGASSLSNGRSTLNADLDGLDSFLGSPAPLSTKQNILTSNLMSLQTLPSSFSSSGRQSPAPKGNKIEVKMNFSSLPSIGTSSTTLPFVLPPPPSSRPQTPAISPASGPPGAMMSLLRSSSPPPRPASPFNIPCRSRAPITTPQSVLATKPIPPPPPLRSQTPRPTEAQAPIPLDVFDDDDFSDFHFHPQPPLAATSSFYDTSFSSTAASDQSLFSSLHSAQSTVSTAESASAFDEFDEFVSSPLRSPSPPRPPAKSFKVATKPTPPTPPRSLIDRPTPQSSQSNTSRTAATQVNHTRTLSLLETAASRPGQWPSPPSPLPDIIPPPRRSCDYPQSQGDNTNPRLASKPVPEALPPLLDHSRTANLLKTATARTSRWPTPLSPLPEAIPPPNAPRVPNLFETVSGGGGSTMQQQQAQAVAGMKTSSSSPAILNSMSSNGHRPSNPPPFNLHPPPSFALFPSPSGTLSPMQLKPPPPPSAVHMTSTKTSSTMGKGGLSAQDISFFEGL